MARVGEGDRRLFRPLPSRAQRRAEEEVLSMGEQLVAAHQHPAHVDVPRVVQPRQQTFRAHGVEQVVEHLFELILEIGRDLTLKPVHLRPLKQVAHVAKHPVVISGGQLVFHPVRVNLLAQLPVEPLYRRPPPFLGLLELGEEHPGREQSHRLLGQPVAARWPPHQMPRLLGH